MQQKYKLKTLQIKLQRNNFHSGGFTSNAKGQLHVLGHDGHPPGVDGAQVGVLEQRPRWASEASYRAPMAAD